MDRTTDLRGGVPRARYEWSPSEGRKGCRRLKRALDVLDGVERATGISYQVLAGRARQRRISDARKVAVLALRCHGFSLQDIGAVLGGRHHTTILSAIRSARWLARRFSGFRFDVQIAIASESSGLERAVSRFNRAVAG